MQHLDIPTHGRAPTADSFNRTDNTVRNTVADNTTAGGEQKFASTDPKVITEWRNPTHECKERAWFTINAFGRTQDSDESTMRRALRGSDQKLWCEAINNKIGTLGRIHCSEFVVEPAGNKRLNSEFSLKRKRNEREIISRYKAWLIVCANGEHDFHKNSFSAVTDFTVAKNISCIALQKNDASDIWISRTPSLLGR